MSATATSTATAAAYERAHLSPLAVARPGAGGHAPEAEHESASQSLPLVDCSKDEEQPAGYNSGGYMVVRVGDRFKDGRYHVLRKLGSVPPFRRCLPARSPTRSQMGPFFDRLARQRHPVSQPAPGRAARPTHLRPSDNRHSALKVVKSAARYTETAKDEIKLYARRLPLPLSLTRLPD
jgi:hypothetical protein